MLNEDGLLGGQLAACLNRDKQCRVVLSYCNERPLVTASVIMEQVMSKIPIDLL